MGFIFFGLGSIAAVLGWWLYPETKGVRFDKLDELYSRGVKPRHFKKRARDDETDTKVGAKHKIVTEVMDIEIKE